MLDTLRAGVDVVPPILTKVKEVKLVPDGQSVEKLTLGGVEIGLNPTAVEQFRLFQLNRETDSSGRKSGVGLMLFRGDPEVIDTAIKGINAYMVDHGKSIDAARAVNIAKAVMEVGKTNAEIITIEEKFDGKARVNYAHSGPNRLTRIQTAVHLNIPNFSLIEPVSGDGELIGKWQQLEMAQDPPTLEVLIGGDRAVSVLTGGLGTQDEAKLKSNIPTFGAKWSVTGGVSGSDPLMRYLAVSEAEGKRMPIRDIVGRIHLELDKKLKKIKVPPVIVIR